MKGIDAFVDVGGTLTRIIVRDAVHRDLKNISFTTSIKTLKTQIQTALQPYPKPEKLMVGIRGVWTPAEKNQWRKTFSKMAREVDVMSDVELAHRLVFKGSAGVLLNAGTGSIAFAKSPKGKTARAGGLGPLLGDEGSGFWLGREYLKRNYQATGQLDLVRKFAKNPNPIAAIASLAQKIIENAYGKKGKVEKELVKQSQEHLRDLAMDVISEQNWKGPVPLKLVGGLFHNDRFKKRFIESLPKERFQIG